MHNHVSVHESYKITCNSISNALSKPITISKQQLGYGLQPTWLGGGGGWGGGVGGGGATITSLVENDYEDCILYNCITYAK